MECQPAFSKLMPEFHEEIIIPKDVPERPGQAGESRRRGGDAATEIGIRWPGGKVTVNR
jgi:hypothetical protein